VNRFRALAAGVLALALSAPGPASAQAAGSPGSAAARAGEASLGQKRTTAAPGEGLEGSLEAKKPKAAPGGPTLELETFRKTVEVQVSEKRREEIASLQKLIRLGGGGDAETPEWYFRLAELLWEESQYFFFEEGRRDDRILALGKASPAEVARLEAEKKDLARERRRHQDQAVALYTEVVRRWPDYPRLDEVLFFLGENLRKRNPDDIEALKAYRALIQRFPQSRFVPDAWMAFGEHWFEKANKQDRVVNLRKALDSYRKAAADRASSVYGYALYKQAWVHYNLAEWDEALSLFRGVIAFGETETAGVPADRKLALVKEAKKDYVRTYSHVGSAEAAVDEFRRVGGEAGWWDMTKALAAIYFDDGKDRDAVVLHARLVRERPLSPEAPFFQSRIVTSAGRMGRKDAATQQAHVFVRMLREIEAQGVKTDADRKALEDARREAENTLRTLAVQYHQEWKKTRDEPVAGFAEAVYRDYLEVFPDAPTAYEMRFFHAELLYALGQFEPAAEQYEKVAAADRARAKAGEKPGKFLEAALESAVFAWDVVAKRLPEEKGAAEPTKRVPMAPARRRLVQACEGYLETLPRGEKWVEIAYKAANIRYRHNEFAEASDLFTRIALDHPTHELAGYATNLVLDAYNLLGDWRNVNGWAKRFWANARLVETHPGLKDDLARVIEQSAFKVIEEHERAGDHEAAAEAYLAFARDWPASRLAPTAYFNASVDHAKAGRLDRALEVRDLLLQKFPQDPLAPRALHENAVTYEAIADFERAAAAYERYFEGWRRSRAPAAPAAKGKGKGKGPAPAAAPAPGRTEWDARKAEDAIVNAAVFRAGLRDWARAEAATRAYLEVWPQGPDARRLARSLADLAARQGSAAKELARLEEYQRTWTAKDPEEWLAVQERIADVMEKAGNARGAARARELGLAHWKRHRAQVKERGLALVAQALYDELEPEFAAYDRITLDVAPKYLKGQLQVKGKRLAALEARYGEIVKLKQPDPAICALHRIGLGYQRFAKALFDAPIPKELRREPALVEEYRAQLAQVAEPLEAKSLEGLELAVTTSREYGVTNACSKAAEAHLAKKAPDRFGPPLERVPALPAPALAAEAPRGYGPLAEVQPVPSRARARVAEPELPPLRPAVRPASAGGAARPGPAGRALADDPEPDLRKKRQAKDGEGAEEDEDLLP
jgi:TolA-binding protein